jgi:carbamoyl-phosphate synthase large subunit
MQNNLLITCGGKWVGMVRQFRNAMKSIEELQGGLLFVADADPTAPAMRFADRGFQALPIDDDSYVDSLLGICQANQVRVVIPLIDIDLVKLAPHRSRFETLGTSILCPSPEIVHLCLDKMEFASFLLSIGLRSPRRYALADLEAARYPLFYKRCRGYGSIGSGICYSTREATAALERDPDLIFQDYVQAPEMSVDGFVNLQGQPVHAVQRMRDKIVGGEAVRTHTVKIPEVAELADCVCRSLASRGFSGPLNLQLFLTDPAQVIEVNPRLGSASLLANVATGGKFFADVLRHCLCETPSGDPELYGENVAMYRYYGETFYQGVALLPEMSCQ